MLFFFALAKATPFCERPHRSDRRNFGVLNFCSSATVLRRRLTALLSISLFISSRSMIASPPCLRVCVVLNGRWYIKPAEPRTEHHHEFPEPTKWNISEEGETLRGSVRTCVLRRPTENFLLPLLVIGPRYWFFLLGAGSNTERLQFVYEMSDFYLWRVLVWARGGHRKRKCHHEGSAKRFLPSLLVRPLGPLHRPIFDANLNYSVCAA